MFEAVLAFIAILFIGHIFKSMVKPHMYPPGPKWYPIFGSSSIVQQFYYKYGSQWKAFSILAKQYSTQVLGLKLGSDHTVVVFGEKNVREVFTEEAFEGRPDSYFFRLRCLGKRLGITFTDGPLWKLHRSFTVKHLKNVGFSKAAMENEIKKELDKIITYIDMNFGKPIEPTSIFANSVMNILWRFSAGEEIDEHRLKYLLDLFHKRSKVFNMAGGLLNQWPWMRFIFPESSGYNLIKNLNYQISEIIQEAIEKHKKGLLKENDFITLFLEQMKTENNGTFTEEQLEIILLDLLIAGSQTTSNTVDFALLAALRNPSMQNKIYNEINEVLGDDAPCWNDSARLIYTMAFLWEVQRYYVIVPLAGPRKVLQDYTLDGYFLAKGTTVLISVRDIHFDPKLWVEPETFNPERFINENGQLYNTEHLYPFGLGRRRCPGDSLAKSFLFIIFVGVMQKFKINCCNGVLPSDDPIMGIISSPRPFTAEFIRRK